MNFFTSSKLKSAAAVLMLALTPLLAQAEGKIAVLNAQAAIVNTEAAQKRLKELRAQPDYAQDLKHFETLKKEHEKIVSQLKKDLAVMGPEQKQAESQKIKSKVADIQHVAGKLQNAEKALLQQLSQEMGPQMQKAVQEIIQEEKIGLLLNPQAVMHADASYDISAKVTDKLNQL